MKLAILFVSVSVACAALTPGPTGPGTDWPCGYHGISCGGGMCCDENEICGGANEGVKGAPFSGSAAGMCCYAGPPEFAVSVGAPKQQSRATRNP